MARISGQNTLRNHPFFADWVSGVEPGGGVQFISWSVNAGPGSIMPEFSSTS